MAPEDACFASAQRGESIGSISALLRTIASPSKYSGWIHSGVATCRPKLYATLEPIQSVQLLLGSFRRTDRGWRPIAESLLRIHGDWPS